MRSILITVMMIIVVVLLFTSIVGGASGMRANIQSKGTTANTNIENLAP